jgi:protein-glutamine gamma-glutamyltransferase
VTRLFSRTQVAEPAAREHQIRQENLPWLLGAQSLVLLPLLFQLPRWFLGLWLGVIVWRLAIVRGYLGFPSLIVKVIVGLLAITALFVSFKSLLGIEPMVGFLVSAFLLKVLELRTQKDGILLIFIGFIAVAAQFLFLQSLLMALYAALSAGALITSWHTIYLSRDYPLGTKFKAGFLLLAHSTPLMLVLFLIMPRIGPLWQVPLPQAQARTGFSDSLSPGDIGHLAQQGGTAFRVTFTEGGQGLGLSDLYWRGLTLDVFDGRSWSASPDAAKPLPKAPPTGAETLTYDVLLEPHDQAWLFALPLAQQLTAPELGVEVNSRGDLQAREPVSRRSLYRVTSDLTATEGASLAPRWQAHYRALPAGFNPQTEAMMASLRERYPNNRELLAALAVFFHQDFYYTLSPPLLGRQSVDDFLFSTRRGFCEHFASSLAVMLRFAGIPARVVIGYQGGLYNPAENYWWVRQADAHAWVEYWQTDLGWQRLDPTAWVAPERIEQGVMPALSDSEQALLPQAAVWGRPWLARLQLQWDALGFVWHRNVLGFSRDTQLQLFARLLGGTAPWQQLLGVTAALALGLLGVFAWLAWQFWVPQSPLSRAMAAFDRRASLAGKPRAACETLSDYCRRLKAQYPAAVSNSDMADSLNRLADLGDRYWYQGDLCVEKALRYALRNFPHRRLNT